MAENIGEATVKITADISQLQQKTQEVKSAMEGLGNFTVTTEGFSGSLDEYNKYIKEANENVQTHEEYLAGCNRVMEDLRKHMEQYPAPIRQTTENLQEMQTEAQDQIGFWENFKDRIVQIGDMAEGSFMRARDQIRETDRVGRTALIALSAAVVAFAKSSINEYAKYNEEFAKSQEQTEKSISKIKAAIGGMLSPIVNVLGGLAQWIGQNQQLATGLFTTIAIIGGAAGLIALIRKLTGAIAALKVTAGGIIGIISVLVGLFVGLNTETQDFSVTTEELLQDQEEQEEQAKELEKAYSKYGGAVDDTADKIADLREQMEKLTRQYRQNLKQILVNHETTVNKLTTQIREANIDYQRAVDERLASFKVSQAKEEQEHQEKVDALMVQLRFLQRYNNKYNQEKLQQVQFALAKEQRLYEQRTQAEKEELDIQLANERAKYEEKIEAYQQELNDELAFLRKHRDLLNSVRDVILEDEVESLTRQYNEQMASYQKQIDAARASGAAAANGWASSYADAMKSKESLLKSAGNSAGDAYGNGFFAGVGKWFDDLINKIASWIADVVSAIDQFFSSIDDPRMSGFSTNPDYTRIQKYRGGGGGNFSGRANGGYTGAGGKWEVADDIIVHRGEYVLPQEMVDQTTHLPKSMGNITINVSGTFATSASERRKVAQDIVSALEQTNYARLGA